MVFCKCSFLFAGHGKSKEWVSQVTHKPTSEFAVPEFLASGGMAGCIFAFAETPVDLVKCQLQMRGKEFSGFRDCIVKIYRSHGTRGLFQGFAATQIRDIPGFAFYFGTYDGVKKYFGKGQTATQMETYKLLIAGALAGLAIWGGIYPLDVIKSSLQSDHTDKSQRQYKNWMDCAKKIYAKNGTRGFFKGLAPCLLRSAPANAVGLFAYEWSLKFMAKIG